MRVHVSGCVIRQGWLEMRQFATVRGAIRAAGGLRREGLLFPSGVVTIRSGIRLSRRRVVRRRFDMHECPPLLDAIRLHNDDSVIVQFGAGVYKWSQRRVPNEP